MIAIAIFAGVLLLVVAIIFLFLKRERAKEKKTYDTLVEKIARADRISAGEEVEPDEEDDAPPQYTKAWAKSHEPLREAVARLGETSYKAATALLEFDATEEKLKKLDSDTKYPGGWMAMDPNVVQAAFDKLVRKHVEASQVIEARNNAAIVLKETSLPAKDAWDALNVILGKLPSEELSETPLEMRTLLSAAIKLRDFRKETIKTAAEKALQYKPVKVPGDKARNTYDKLENKLLALRQEFIDAVVASAECVPLAEVAKTASQVVLAWSSSDFEPEPAKPTEEEVIRFMRLYETWSIDRLPKLRTAAETTKALRKIVAKAEIALETFQMSMVKISGYTIENSDKQVCAFLASCSQLLDSLEETHSVRKEDLREAEDGHQDDSLAKAVGTAREDEHCDNIWALARKLAYAIAQRRIAAAKLHDQQGQGKPEEPPSPEPTGGDFDLEAYLALHSDYLDAMAVYAEEVGVIDARTEVLTVNRAARMEKIVACAALLSEASIAIEKEIKPGDRCDKLRCRLLFAKKLAGDFLNSDDQSQYTKHLLPV